MLPGLVLPVLVTGSVTSITANTSIYNGNPGNYTVANLGLISVADTVDNANTGVVTLASINGGASGGQLYVDGLRGNGDGVGSVGFKHQ